MSKKLQSFVIDFKIGLLLLLLIEILPLRSGSLLVVASLRCFRIIIIVLLGVVHDIISIVLSLHVEQRHLLVSCKSVDSLLQTISISEVFLDFLRKLQLETLMHWRLLLQTLYNIETLDLRQQ